MAKSKPKRSETLDAFIPLLRGKKGPQPLAVLVASITGVDEPSTGQVHAAIDMLQDDDRFVLTNLGVESTVSLSAAMGDEPEELKVESAEMGTSAMPSNVIPGPGSTEQAPIVEEAKTIGEQLTGDQAADITAAALSTFPEGAKAVDDDRRWLVLKDLVDKLQLAEGEHTRLKKAASNAKAEVETLREQMTDIIKGETEVDPKTLPVFQENERASSEKKAAPAATDQKPMLVEQGFDFFTMGIQGLQAGLREDACPISREKDANGVTRWLAGYRSAFSEVTERREAQVQALFRDTLLDAALPNHGLLPKGEEQPKVKTVKWDERPHLVLDMCVFGDVECWYLQPCFTKDEWSDSFQELYGVPCKANHVNGEMEEDRLKGGVDCARLIKSGRSVLVVGPRQRVSIATVKVGEAQPPH